MDEQIVDSLIRNNQSILCSGLFKVQRLTPTGKISHAKTRVYTQRYRKEWEQMPDFREWLTAVPDQATRAYCSFCKKNLHAHRLSLLKHTCTMKHQRAALMHHKEMNAQQATAMTIAQMEAGYEDEEEQDEEMPDPSDMVIQKMQDRECDEANEDFEYVVETLEMDDENDANDDDVVHDDNDENDDENDEDDEDDDRKDDGDDDDANTDENERIVRHPQVEDNEDLLCLPFRADRPLISVNKKIKVEQEDVDCRDTLAEAMAHVHGDFMDGSEEPVNVDMEMVVGVEDESINATVTNSSINSMQDVSCRLESNENEQRKNLGEKTSAQDGDSCETGSEFEISSLDRLRDIEKSCKNFKDVFNASGIGTQLPFGTPLSIPSGQTKTLKLNTGKTVTLKPGTQFVLSKIKANQLTGLLLADRKQRNQSAPGGSMAKLSRQSTTSNSSLTKQNFSAVIAGTSKQLSNQQKTGLSSIVLAKKPCISTHVVDLSKGLPIGGLQVSLYKLMDGRWTFINESNTSPNGRCNDLVDSGRSNLTAGRYKMHFDVDKYFTLRRIETMYPFIEIVFDVKNPMGDYHIPVLLSPFGYTTYRGSSDR